MLLSSLNTGSTDLRDTDVQQPNTTETLSLLISSRAFSANSGQLEAGSTTTASSLRPSTPPFLFCSSISMSMTSFNVVSLIAIVPESECRMPILIGGSSACSACAKPKNPKAQARPAARSHFRLGRRVAVSMVPVCPPYDRRHRPAAQGQQLLCQERAWIQLKVELISWAVLPGRNAYPGFHAGAEPVCP